MGVWADRRKRYSRMATEGHLSRYLFGLVLVKSGLSSRLVIERGDYKLHFHPSALSLTLWANPQDRGDDEKFVRSWLEAGDTYVDVGANIGNLVLVAAAAVGPLGSVVGVEPHPRTYGYLVSNVALNRCSNVALFNVALGAAEGRVPFRDGWADDQNAVSDVPTGVVVSMTTLDQLPIPQGPVALLKVDVEGFERYVFEGGHGVLSRTEAVLFEAWEAHFAGRGYSTGDLVSLLAAHGHRVYRRQGGAFAEVSSTYRAERCEDLLAVSPSGMGRMAKMGPTTSGGSGLTG